MAVRVHDGTVTGTYSYPNRPGTTYRLAGVNPRAGILTLDEFTRQYEQGINYYFVAHAPPKRRWFRRRG